jgi:hypothetical protein
VLLPKKSDASWITDFRPISLSHSVGKIACSFGLSTTSHQYFSQNKPATSNQPAVLFSQNKSAPAISHQPNEQADYLKTHGIPASTYAQFHCFLSSECVHQA